MKPNKIQCSECAESPDWGGFYFCLGCGKAICYLCNRKENGFIETYVWCGNEDIYDDHGRAVTWRLCKQCQKNPPRKLSALLEAYGAICDLERQVWIRQNELINLFNWQFPNYKDYDSMHHATMRTFRAKVTEEIK